MRVAPVAYSTLEIESYLPSGWSLAGPPGGWDGKSGVWSVLVRDGADQEWKLEVPGTAAEKRGRLDALKRAADDLYRDALG